MASFIGNLTPIVVSLGEQKVQVKEPVSLIQIQEPVRLIQLQEPLNTIQVQEPVNTLQMQSSTETEETPSKPSQNAIWGPLLWRILHIIVEQLGKPKHSLTQTDEVQKWIQMMRSVEHTMPCALCRGHYREWLVKHPLGELSSLRGQAFREGARKYVWQLHENVNTSRNLSSGISLEQCQEMYASCETLQDTLDTFTKFVQEIISAGRFKGEGLKEFRKQLTYVRKLADCI